MASSAAELDDKDQRILELIESKPGGFVGTAEVAEELGLTTNGAAYRLDKLKKAGKIASRQPSRDEVWYIEGLNQPLELVAVLVAVGIAGVVGYVATILRAGLVAWTASNPAALMFVVIWILTAIAVYPWVVLARRTFAPGWGLPAGELRAALRGVIR